MLDRNKIRQLEVHALRGLANLRELRLEENGLRSLDGHPPSTFAPTPTPAPTPTYPYPYPYSYPCSYPYPYPYPYP